jgi:hypothetical protein
MDDYLSKPVHRDTLSPVLHRLRANASPQASAA